MKTHLFTLIALLLSLCSVLQPANTALAHDYSAQCVIGFDNQFSIRNVYAQARATFAYNTAATTEGNVLCEDSSDRSCWTYREKCGKRSYVRVQEAPIGQYKHFHLAFEDQSLSCFADNGDGLGTGFGRTDADGSCTAANWAAEPRFVAGHTAEHLLHIWLEDQTTQKPRPFELASIRIRGTMNAKIWYRKSDGKWYYWDSLAPGRWNLSAYLWDITEVMIQAAQGSTTSVAFDDLVIRH